MSLFEDASTSEQTSKVGKRFTSNGSLPTNQYRKPTGWNTETGGRLFKHGHHLQETLLNRTKWKTMEQCSIVTGREKNTSSFRETAVGLNELATHVGTRWWKTMQTPRFH